MAGISNEKMFSYIPRLLGVYPVISSNQQLTEFTQIWNSCSSVEQLQVYNFYNVSYTPCIMRLGNIKALQ